MEADEGSFNFFGTPIEREEELTSRKKKAVAEASGQLRTLPAWKQEVRDEEGRRRFHGAFTGGYSAGYYNTVGSKEGWTPQAFTSSRKNRSEFKQQSVLNFMDEDEKAELEGRSLATSSKFDTFGFTANEVARKQLEKEKNQRPSAIPGPIPDELLLVPTSDSIGVKLLLKMGWRRGRSIKESKAESLYDTRREARKALLAFAFMDKEDSEKSDADAAAGGEETKHDVETSNRLHAFVHNPKLDVYGLGYDPYKNAPEFRDKKRARISGTKERKDKASLSLSEKVLGFKSGKAAPGFGIGALEEYDVEDEDVYTSAYDFEENYVKEVEDHVPSSDNKVKLTWKEHDSLRKFKPAAHINYRVERFHPPDVPPNFKPLHVFPSPLATSTPSLVPPPQEVHAPQDNTLKVLIEGVASLVSRCGKLFEDLSREKNKTNPLFNFLNGGNGHEYYLRKLWEEQQKRCDSKPILPRLNQEKIDAETRGRILGEKPLERTATVNVTVQLSDTFTESSSGSGLSEAFKFDPAKQERFEMFLKEKQQGGLRSTHSGGSSFMSEAARARERLDFEAAAEVIEKRKGKFVNADSMAIQFTSPALEKTENINHVYPKREEFQWRPFPVLCKRFDLIDPFMGKPPPPPRIRSKLDSLIFTSEIGKSKKMEPSPVSDKKNQNPPNDDVAEEPEVEGGPIERPVDLFKAIFSDDEEDDDDSPELPVETSKPVAAAVAQTTLNRLVAGDFLDSIGKELGFEVPADPPPPLPSSRKDDRSKSLSGRKDDKSKSSSARKDDRSKSSSGRKDDRSKSSSARKDDRSTSSSSSSDDDKNMRHSRRRRHSGDGDRRRKDKSRNSKHKKRRD